jgi:hypothetical protein
VLLLPAYRARTLLGSLVHWIAGSPAVSRDPAWILPSLAPCLLMMARPRPHPAGHEPPPASFLGAPADGSAGMFNEHVQVDGRHHPDATVTGGI